MEVKRKHSTNAYCMFVLPTIDCNKFNSLQTLERLRITFTTNGRNDHVTMFILHLRLAVLFLSKIRQFCASIKDQNYFALFSSM